jgi:hypothetical protein
MTNSNPLLVVTTKPKAKNRHSHHVIILNSTQGVRKSNASMFVFLFYSQARYAMKQNVNYNSECTLAITHFSTVSLSFNTMLPAVHNVFEPFAAEVFRLFSKPFSHSNLNFFITCEMKGSEMFLESYKQPEVRRCQIWAVQKGWNNFKSDAMYCR